MASKEATAVFEAMAGIWWKYIGSRTDLEGLENTRCIGMAAHGTLRRQIGNCGYLTSSQISWMPTLIISASQIRDTLMASREAEIVFKRMAGIRYVVEMTHDRLPWYPCVREQYVLAPDSQDNIAAYHNKEDADTVRNSYANSMRFTKTEYRVIESAETDEQLRQRIREAYKR